MNELAIFANDIDMLNNEYRMTLKSITDSLRVRHDNAMNVVENMAEIPEFGEILKISSSYSKGNNAPSMSEDYAFGTATKGMYR